MHFWFTTSSTYNRVYRDGTPLYVKEELWSENPGQNSIMKFGLGSHEAAHIRQNLKGTEHVQSSSSIIHIWGNKDYNTTQGDRINRKEGMEWVIIKEELAKLCDS